MTTFTDLKLSAPLLQALATEGYEKPTPIQTQAIPSLLDGRDLLGIAQTGTGKTAAFALPLLHRLTSTDRRAAPRNVRALILTPTRELCIQILDSFRTYGRHLRIGRAAVYGGVGQGPQVQALARGVDVLVATPGRLLDLMNQGQVRFDMLEAFVLDEADRMLDMGFIVPVKRIVAKLPKERQTLLFSATMPQDVAGLAASLLKQPVRVEVTPVATTAERVSQRVHLVEKANKRALLQHLLNDPAVARALVFARTKHGANKVADHLARAGIRADAIHGNKSQNARQKALNDFRDGRVRVLVATDIAARGIDVDGITHVINFDLPNEPESYVHRIGRTARAGADGIAISFCDAEERAFLRDIEKTIRQKVDVDAGHPFHAAHLVDGHRAAAQPARGNDRGRHHGGPRHGQSGGVAAPDRTRHRDGSGRNEGQRRSRHAGGEQAHGEDRAERNDGRNRPRHPREQAHGEGRPEHNGAPRGHTAQARGAGSRAPHQPHGHRHETGKAASGGHKAHGSHPHGNRHPRQDNGGRQPLKRAHRGQPQRFEPVRMG
jgi:ATP-dependent RNA helicase RhlE